MLKYIKSDPGSNILIDDGFMYHFEKYRDKKIIWKCVIYKKKNKCRGRVHVINDKIFKIHVRNHVLDTTQIETKIVVNEMKNYAICNTNSSSHAVIGTLAFQISLAVAGQLPSVPSLKQTIQRVRQDDLQAPITPKDFNFDISDKYAKTLDGELFLQSNTERILLFSTMKNLELMSNCDNWFCDGTFSCAPNIFKQIYTIHAFFFLFAINCRAINCYIRSILPRSIDGTPSKY